jgi:hypothetical protein
VNGADGVDVRSVAAVRILPAAEVQELNPLAWARWLELEVVEADGEDSTYYMRSADLRHATMGLTLRPLVRAAADADLLQELGLSANGGGAPSPPPLPPCRVVSSEEILRARRVAAACELHLPDSPRAAAAIF